MALPCPWDARRQDGSARTQLCIAPSVVALGGFEGVTGTKGPQRGHRLRSAATTLLEILPPTNTWAQLGDAAQDSQGSSSWASLPNPLPISASRDSDRGVLLCAASGIVTRGLPGGISSPLQGGGLGITHPHPGWKRLGMSQGTFLRWWPHPDG